MIPIAKPWIGEEEKQAVLTVLESGMLAQGQKVREFEQAFADYIGVKHAIATSNGTTALHVALVAHDITEGDEVITTPFSFIATANAIKMVGATPVFVDVEEGTYNINPDLIEQAITHKTKTILPVHLFGLPANMERIQDIATKHGVTVIEDACQAHNASFNGKKVGATNTSCFSFYPTKNMTTGEGGIITTNDDVVAAKLRKLIDHGSEQKYYHSHLGYNYRMTDIAAAIGCEQLKKLDMFTAVRKRNANLLREGLQGIPGVVLPQGENHVFHQFTVRVKNRDEVATQLRNRGIGTSIFYPQPIHKQQAYRHHNMTVLPVAEKLAQEVLSLPVHPLVREEDVATIIQAVKEVV